MGLTITGFPSEPDVGEKFTIRDLEYVYSEKGWRKNLKSFTNDKLGKDDTALNSLKFNNKSYDEIMKQLKVTVINEISDGAESTFMTLKGIENEIEENDSSISAILKSISTKASVAAVNDLNTIVGDDSLSTESSSLTAAINELDEKKFNKKDIINIIRPLLKLVTEEGINDTDIDEAINAIIDDIDNGDI